MNKYGINELRKSFLEFFESKGHLVAPSYSLVPKNDPSLLLINAGMSPLKAYFTGAKEPPGKRMATCQKCIRTPDIENVGKTSRHGTFFEMLGNFSFGDYFKKEAINWAWEYLTQELRIDPSLLYASVYQEDDEAYEIWKQVKGFDERKIVKLGKDDNFWEHGTGPCGPCSEIYYDRGVEYGCGDAECKPGCDCDRFIEVWNLVFTQFDKDEQGRYNPLPKPNIDTGMGLERLAVVCQGAKNLFETDTIKDIIDMICDITGSKYGKDHDADVSIRVITDHIRGTVHMISDGIIPSNEGRGYVLRRLIRRAARHSRLLGAKSDFLHELTDLVIKLSGEAYPGLIDKRDYIYKVILTETQKFSQTIDTGMEILGEMIKKADTSVLSGEDVFLLHDTFGFPKDLTLEIAQENGIGIDLLAFEKLMKAQKERAREAFMSKSAAWDKGDSRFDFLLDISNEFTGYDSLTTISKPSVIFSDQGLLMSAGPGDVVNVIFEKTPFYAQSGGQVSDSGDITGHGFIARVTDVKKLDELHVHEINIIAGRLDKETEYTLLVDKAKRAATMRNHTATHILHKALTQELGAHIEQKGSYVDDIRLRFDFCHFEPIDKKVLEIIEGKINRVILEAVPVTTRIMTPDEAKESGAKALFDEKYQDMVRVVSVGDHSSELCGGTHVSNSGQIGVFHIISENGIASGIRRIEALTGENALDHFKKTGRIIDETGALLKSGPEDLPLRVKSMLDTVKSLTQRIDELQKKIGTAILENDSNTADICGFTVISRIFEKTDIKMLREMIDEQKARHDDLIILFASTDDNKVTFVAGSSDSAIKKGVMADKLIKETAGIAGGGGGGKPSFAQAGGKDPSMTQKALDHGISYIKSILCQNQSF